ncbi:IS1182 family transposase, partial [Puniceicoccaceae bacterium K14]|nr:IS1182 family transposase [Puniceicoccaceae bacterium K14]
VCVKKLRFGSEFSLWIRIGKVDSSLRFDQPNMTYIEGESRDQELLLPESIEDYVSEENPVRFVEAFVDQLDMEECGFERRIGKTRGRPSYNPRDLLKLYLFGYMNRNRSSRMLERACHVNLEAIWLMRKLKPDHKTIAEFRRKNPKAFKQCFRKFVLLCRNLGLLGSDLVAIDGTKLKGVNSPRKNLTRSKLQRMIKDADAKLEDYFKRLDDQDARDHNGRKTNKKKLRKRIDMIEGQLAAMKELEKSMEDAGLTQISKTDEDSRSMPKNPRVGVGYNGQAGADEKHGMIVAEDLTNEIHDYDQLAPIAKQAKDNLGSPEKLKIAADKGYDKASQMRAVEDSGMQCYVASREYSRQIGGALYGKDAFRYLKTKDSYKCPADAILPRKHEIEVNGRLRIAYHNSAACDACSIREKCTANKKGRIVYRYRDEEVAAMVRKRMEANPEVYKRRGPTVEKCFGSIKWAMGCENLLMKGLKKCRGEWSLMCLCYNLKRAISILGVEKLVEAVLKRHLRTKSDSVVLIVPLIAILRSENAVGPVFSKTINPIKIAFC